MTPKIRQSCDSALNNARQLGHVIESPRSKNSRSTIQQSRRLTDPRNVYHCRCVVCRHSVIVLASNGLSVGTASMSKCEV